MRICVKYKKDKIAQIKTRYLSKSRYVKEKILLIEIFQSHTRNIICLTCSLMLIMRYFVLTSSYKILSSSKTINTQLYQELYTTIETIKYKKLSRQYLRNVSR